MKSVSGKQLCKALERQGWILIRIKESHHIYVHPILPATLTVPVHGNRDLRIGTLRTIMKEAGLSEDDL